jgi:hypothetical protein
MQTKSRSHEILVPKATAANGRGSVPPNAPTIALSANCTVILPTCANATGSANRKIDGASEKYLRSNLITGVQRYDFFGLHTEFFTTFATRKLKHQHI